LFHVKTFSQFNDGAADVARQADPAHAAILPMHEIIAWSQSDSTRQVGHRWNQPEYQAGG
jgi:hypothetical protein